MISYMHAHRALRSGERQTSVYNITSTKIHCRATPAGPSWVFIRSSGGMPSTTHRLDMFLFMVLQLLPLLFSLQCGDLTESGQQISGLPID